MKRFINIFTILKIRAKKRSYNRRSCPQRMGAYFFDLSNEQRQVRTVEAHAGSWNSMMLDIWWYMLVMRHRRSQSRVVWMREVIIPIESVIASIYFVAIRSDDARVKVNFLSHSQPQAIGKEDFALSDARVWTVGPRGNRGPLNVRLVKQAGKKTTIATQRVQWTRGHQ